jgi:exodeoxyribonuclease VII small subunit
MADDKYTFEQARVRLEEIAVEVRKKDTSLEKSLDLLEEGVRLANICTELVDTTDVGATVTAPRPEGAPAGDEAPSDNPDGDTQAPEGESVAGDGEGAGEPVETPDVPDEETDGFDDVDDGVDEPADAGSDE